MQREIVDKKIELLFKKISETNENTWHMDINQWDWNPGVSLYGVIKTYKNTMGAEYRNFLKEWFEENENWRVFGSVNNVMPANVPLFLLEDEMDYRYYDIVKEYVQWCLNKAYRTNNGGYAHIWKKGDPDYINQLWIDTIFMSAIFLSKYGAMFKHTPSINEAIKQVSIHLECQLDKDSNLCYHAYHCKADKQMGQFWGRGNGWIVVSLIEIIDNLKDTGANLDYFIEIFQKIMQRGYESKAQNGMIHTLVDVEESYLEVTASALFGYAAIKGQKLGYLDDKFLVWSKDVTKAVIENMKDDGTLLNCSAGTNPGTKEEYMNIPLAQTVYAYGICLMLLSEYDEK